MQTPYILYWTFRQISLQNLNFEGFKLKKSIKQFSILKKFEKNFLTSKNASDFHPCPYAALYINTTAPTNRLMKENKSKAFNKSREKNLLKFIDTSRD